MTATSDDLAPRRHFLFMMLTACAWRDTPAAAPVVAGLRTFLGGWLGIGRITLGMARQGFDLQLRRCDGEGLAGEVLKWPGRIGATGARRV